MTSPIETNNVVERLRRTKTQYRTYGAFGCVGIQDETESREVPINPDGPEAADLIKSLSDRIDVLEGALEEAGKAFGRLANGKVGQPENLAFNGWQMIALVMEQSK